MNGIRFLYAGFASLLLAGAAGAQAKLKVGDPAPPIKVAKWVKGQPVTLQKGQAYVVEFWATWCGPCRATIPHLSEMAKKYAGKATFAGISVWENQGGTPASGTLAKVTAFVKEMGPKMTYNVGVDGPAGTMAKSWMEAAGQEGIPAAFIVGKDGKIAWIGHPMDGMEEVLGGVVAGKFNPQAHAAAQAKRQEAEEKQQQLLAKVGELADKEQFKEAVAELDRVLKEHPSLEPRVAFGRFNLLLRSDEPAAYAYGRKLAESHLKDNPEALNALAWHIVRDEANLKAPDYPAAIAIAARAAELTKWQNAPILDTLSYAHFKNGEVKRAIEIQEKALAALARQKGAPEQIRKTLTDRLEMYRKKGAG